MLDLVASLSSSEHCIDPHLGYPPAYAKLCGHSPPFFFADCPPASFLPYPLPPHEESKLSELESLFPSIEQEEDATPADPSLARIHADFLWSQLDHLGNAGFDPSKFRVDPYGNVLHWGADSASPLAWKVDHWFPLSRGGKTLVGNLRLVQWQVAEIKAERLEFLMPWWDTQLGISINQFLFIFASTNADFRQRAISLCFHPNEHLKNLSELESQFWPEHFQERAKQVGHAAAAVVRIKKDIPVNNNNMAELRTPKFNNSAPGTPVRRKWRAEEEEVLRVALQKFRHNKPHTNKLLDFTTAVQREIEVGKKLDAEKRQKDDEFLQMEKELKIIKQQNEREKAALEELEGTLAKQKKRVEKQRHWSETQSHYRQYLERILRETMHQSCVFKEQAKLNQAACTALLARIMSHKMTCEKGELDLAQRSKAREAIDYMCKRLFDEGCLSLNMGGFIDQSLSAPASKGKSNVPTKLDEHNADKECVLEDAIHKQPKIASEAQLRQPLKGMKGMDTILEEEEQKDADEPLVQTHKSPLKRKEFSGEIDDRGEYGYQRQKVENGLSHENIVGKLEYSTLDDHGGFRRGEEEHLDKLLQEVLSLQEGASEEGPKGENNEHKAKRMGKSNVDKWLQKLLLSNSAGSCVTVDKDVELQGTRERAAAVMGDGNLDGAAGNREKSRRMLDGFFRKMSFRQDSKGSSISKERAAAVDVVSSFEELSLEIGGKSESLVRTNGGMTFEDVNGNATGRSQDLHCNSVEGRTLFVDIAASDAVMRLEKLQVAGKVETFANEAQFVQRMREVREEDKLKKSGRMKDGHVLQECAEGLKESSDVFYQQAQHPLPHEHTHKKVEAKSIDNPTLSGLVLPFASSEHQVKRSCSMRAASSGAWVVHKRKGSFDGQPLPVEDVMEAQEGAGIVLQQSRSIDGHHLHHHHHYHHHTGGSTHSKFQSRSRSWRSRSSSSSSSSSTTMGISSMGGIKASLKAWKQAVSSKR